MDFIGDLVGSILAPLGSIATMFHQEELDFTTKLLSFCTLAMLAVQVCYVVCPRVLQRKLETLDSEPHVSAFSSVSFGLGLLTTGAFAITVTQKITPMEKAEANRMSESLIEKEFRHRNAFHNDMHIY